MDGIPILDTTLPPCSQYLLALEASNTDEYFHTKFPVVIFPDNSFLFLCFENYQNVNIHQWWLPILVFHIPGSLEKYWNIGINKRIAFNWVRHVLQTCCEWKILDTEPDEKL